MCSPYALIDSVHAARHRTGSSLIIYYFKFTSIRSNQAQFSQTQPNAADARVVDDEASCIDSKGLAEGK